MICSCRQEISCRQSHWTSAVTFKIDTACSKGDQEIAIMDLRLAKWSGRLGRLQVTCHLRLSDFFNIIASRQRYGLGKRYVEKERPWCAAAELISLSLSLSLSIYLSIYLSLSISLSPCVCVCVCVCDWVLKRKKVGNKNWRRRKNPIKNTKLKERKK